MCARRGLTNRALRVESCVASRYGGGVYVARSSFGVISGAEFVLNTAREGGGLYSSGTTLELIRSNFHNNTAIGGTATEPARGGGVLITGGNNVTFGT